MTTSPVEVTSVPRGDLHVLAARTTIEIPQWHVAYLKLVSNGQVIAYESRVAYMAGIYELGCTLLGPWADAEGSVHVYYMPPRDLMEMARRLGLSYRGATAPEWSDWDDDDYLEA